MNLLEMFKRLSAKEKEELANLIFLNATTVDDNGNKAKAFEEVKNEN